MAQKTHDVYRFRFHNSYLKTRGEKYLRVERRFRYLLDNAPAISQSCILYIWERSDKDLPTDDFATTFPTYQQKLEAVHGVMERYQALRELCPNVGEIMALNPENFVADLLTEACRWIFLD